MDFTAKKLLAKRRDRLIATILGAKEDFCDDYISDDSSEQFRKIILDQLNDYHNLCCDVLKSYESETVVVNEEFLDTLYSIRDALKLAG